MSIEKIDHSFVGKENKEKNNSLNKYEVALSDEEETIVKNLLGIPEEIYFKVENSLDALRQNKEGAYDRGTSAFYNSFIMSSVPVAGKPFFLCKKVINAMVKKIENDQKIEDEKFAEWNQLADSHLNVKPVEKSLIDGAEELMIKEAERTGIDPEEYNNL